MFKNDGEVCLTKLDPRLDPRGQFEDIEEIDLWQNVDEKEDMVGGEEFDLTVKEETIDIETRDMEDLCQQCEYKTTNIETRTQRP